MQKIEPKAMELLILLSEANGELVTRQQIMQTLWQGRYVTDYALNTLVSSLRKHLATDQHKDYIKTRPKRGYQLTIPIEPVNQTQNSVEVSGTAQSQGNAPTNTKLIGFAAVMALMLSIVLFQFFSTGPEAEKENSIAVLPFSLNSDNDSIAFFAEGLGKDIIQQLTLIPEFKIISETSSLSFNDNLPSTNEISNKLGVNYLLRGSVKQEGEVLKVTVQLINAAQDSALWSKDFAAIEDNAYSIQQQISSQVVATLGREGDQIPAEKLRFSPKSGEAYLHLLRGRKYNQARTPDSLLKARDEFQMATLIEPNYAEAYVDLAISYLLMGQNRILTGDEAKQEAKTAIDSALSINPKLPEAYAAMGILANIDGRFDEAKASFENALQYNPDMYLALINYGNLLRSEFFIKEAQVYYERALEISPLSAVANWGMGDILLGLGNLDEAINRYRACVYRIPDDLNCSLGLAYALRLANKAQESDASFARLNKNDYAQDYYYQLADAWHLLWKGNPEQSEAVYESMLAQFGFNIGGLQSISLLKYQLGKQTSWHSRLAEAYQAQSSLLAIKANYALSAYFDDQCDIALPIFEAIFSDHNEIFTDADLMANGVSYHAMLTYCYLRLDKTEDAQRMLALYADAIQALPQNKNFIPGFYYAKAQYYALAGERDKADEKVAALVTSGWPLLWLVERNPILN